MKKLLMLIVALSMFSCAMETNFEKENQGNSTVLPTMKSVYYSKTVSLLKFTGYTHSKYSMSQWQRSFVVRAKKISDSQKVYIHHETKNNGWIDIEASYFSDADEGYALYNLYDFRTSYIEYDEELGTSFVVKFVADSVVYWDNNDGQNYDFSSSVGSYLAEGLNILVQEAYYNNNLYGSIDIKNIGYHKDVTVVYSYDNWKTVNEVKAEYRGPYYNYGYARFESPNIHGIERWYFAAESSINPKTGIMADDVEFAVKYVVNGKTYWDNNYGLNYKISKQ